MTNMERQARIHVHPPFFLKIATRRVDLNTDTFRVILLSKIDIIDAYPEPIYTEAQGAGYQQGGREIRTYPLKFDGGAVVLPADNVIWEPISITTVGAAILHSSDREPGVVNLASIQNFQATMHVGNRLESAWNNGWLFRMDSTP